MATDAQATGTILHKSSNRNEFLRKGDWWAVWLGLGLTVAAVLLYLQGASIKWLAVTPKKWSAISESLADQLATGTNHVPGRIISPTRRP